MPMMPELSTIFMLVIIAGIGMLLQHPSYPQIHTRVGIGMTFLAALNLILNFLLIVF